METRPCEDGAAQTCVLSDQMRITPCHEHDCPRMIGAWTNIGACNATDEDSCGKCGDGNQKQTRSCQDGTTDKCNNLEIDRTITCSAAGTAYPVCEKLPGKTCTPFLFTSYIAILKKNSYN